MKKVVHILTAGIGGCFDVVKNIIEGDVEKKMQAVLIFYGNVPLVDFFKTYCETNQIEYYYFRKKSKFDFQNHYKIWKLWRKLKADAVFFHSMNSLLYFYLFDFFKKKNFIAVEHQPYNLKTKVDKIYTLFGVLLATKLVLLNEAYYKRHLQKFGFLLNKKTSNVIYNGIKIKESNNYKLKAKEATINFGIFCRMSAIKDLFTLIDATAILAKRKNNIKLHLAGEGEVLEDLKSKIKKLNIGEFVKVYGVVSKSKVFELLGQLDFYVQATKGETSCISILDAANFGVPVIAANVADLNTLYNNKLLLYYECGNANDLADKMMEIIENDELKLKLSDSFFQFVSENLGRVKMAKSYAKLV